VSWVEGWWGEDVQLPGRPIGWEQGSVVGWVMVRGRKTRMGRRLRREGIVLLFL
jgi:hypothetical protein